MVRIALSLEITKNLFAHKKHTTAKYGMIYIEVVVVVVMVGVVGLCVLAVVLVVGGRWYSLAM